MPNWSNLSVDTFRWPALLPQIQMDLPQIQMDLPQIQMEIGKGTHGRAPFVARYCHVNSDCSPTLKRNILHKFMISIGK
ncbi:hypothetical protein DPMN_020039 [Dreissena polymorpha]|uniref:Uncharacterized protein n=1 Tax=Dreissena polymorpha TaxID=45954 RepID=A0A9D4NLZ9_DREPO|nr:hypothetical protein DPMN_020039 [Dreissena polymorpha]